MYIIVDIVYTDSHHPMRFPLFLTPDMNLGALVWWKPWPLPGKTSTNQPIICSSWRCFTASDNLESRQMKRRLLSFKTMWGGVVVYGGARKQAAQTFAGYDGSMVPFWYTSLCQFSCSILQCRVSMSSHVSLLKSILLGCHVCRMHPACRYDTSSQMRPVGWRALDL